MSKIEQVNEILEDLEEKVADIVILVAITKKEPNIGLITLEMEDTSKKISEVFKLGE
ncbi:MAG: hypothetical protein P8Y97_16065 [Candidatus Lokiarchaeota archaeon]